MAFDIWQSRRNMNERCFWWSQRDDEEIPEEELVFKRVPDGSFYAKEENAEATNDNILSGVMMVERTTVMISSADDLSSLYNDFSLRSHCYVKYDDDFWIVTDVQKRKVKIQNTEFGNTRRISHRWYISLRK